MVFMVLSPRDRRLFVASLGGLVVMSFVAFAATIAGHDGFFLVFMFPLFLWPWGLRH